MVNNAVLNGRLIEHVEDFKYLELRIIEEKVRLDEKAGKTAWLFNLLLKKLRLERL